MAQDSKLLGTCEGFSSALEAEIKTEAGLFEGTYPVFKTALRGIAERLGCEFLPLGLVVAAETYLCDVARNEDGFTGKPMPSEVTGIPADLIRIFVRETMGEVATLAFGQEFGGAVDQIYRDLLDEPVSAE
jgi:hypothetical protein